MAEENATTKSCSKCKQNKHFSFFHRHSKSRDGLQSWCKSCCRDHGKRRYESNREYQIAKAKEWKRNNEDRARENWQRFYKKNRDKLIKDRIDRYHSDIDREKSVKRAWRETRRDESSRKTLEYLKKNPWVATRQVAKRKAAKLRATPSWADHEAIESIYKEAATIQALTGVKHNVDHIVPLLSKFVCGLHCEANLQILTRDENYRKSNVRWPDMP